MPDRHQRWALKSLGNLGGFAQIANGSFVRNSVEKVDLPDRGEISFQLIGSVWNIDSSSCATGCNRFWSAQ
ncbi:MAG: hypothetical protein HEQ18_11790 [Sphingorhabdus sp.]